MNLIECSRCGKLIQKEASCPNCGSSDRVKIVSIHDKPELMEGFSMSFRSIIRNWVYRPAAIQHHLSSMTGDASVWLVKGICQDVIDSCQALVEGVITDSIEEDLESVLYIQDTRNQIEQVLDELNFKTWGRKKEIAKEFCNWDLKALESFEIVDLFFGLRNQASHGRSYHLRDTRVLTDNKLTRLGPLVIDNKKFSDIYKALEEKQIVPAIASDASMNMDMFYTPIVAKANYEHAVGFLRSFLKAYRPRSNYSMSHEFESALKGGW
jgi:hypothetical protein